MMESFGTCSDGRVDDRMRRLQQQLEEMEIRAQESAKRVEKEGSRVGQLQRELAGKTREVQLARGSLSSTFRSVHGKWHRQGNNTGSASSTFRSVHGK